MLCKSENAQLHFIFKTFRVIFKSSGIHQHENETSLLRLPFLLFHRIEIAKPLTFLQHHINTRQNCPRA
jgi:hypothetical protein